jgi:hypothetical protein
MIRVDGEKNNLEMDGDVLTVMTEIALIVHDLSMIEHIPNDAIISAVALGLAHKGTGNTRIYKGIIEDVRRKAVDIIENGFEEDSD